VKKRRGSWETLKERNELVNRLILPGWLFLLVTLAAIPAARSQPQAVGLPVLSLSAATYHTGEGGPAVVIVHREGDMAGNVTVTCTTLGVTATAGSDFTSVSESLSFAPGVTSVACLVPILNNEALENAEIFTVSLSDPAGATLGEPASATITIIDDDDPVQAGQWGMVLPMPVIPIHAHLLPTGDVLIWDRHDDDKGWDGMPRLWQPSSNSFTMLSDPGYEIFCSGHTFLADGRLFIAGGHRHDFVGEDNAVIFDPFTNEWTALPLMEDGRWYPSATTMGNGEVAVMAGTMDGYNDVNPLPQVWETTNHDWRDLTTAPYGIYPEWAQIYPFNFLAPDGRVFVAGPQQMARYLDTAGTGAWEDVDASALEYRDYGSAVMYDEGMVLMLGGNPADASAIEVPSSSVEAIDLTGTTPTWQLIEPMTIGRRHLNSILLPDGNVLVTGGTSLPGFDNRAGGVYYAEMWNPETGQWTVLDSYTRYRGYHSMGMLLADGRVVIAGGGHPHEPGGADELNAEIFSPPYLFRGPRPVVTAAPAEVGYGQPFLVATPDGETIAEVNWIRLPSVTHGFDQNQRLNRLAFSQTEGGVVVRAPADPNLAPPGHYMLFILNQDSVPSVARIVRLGADVPTFQLYLPLVQRP
jgi:hypothetical protein